MLTPTLGFMGSTESCPSGQVPPPRRRSRPSCPSSSSPLHALGGGRVRASRPPRSSGGAGGGYSIAGGRQGRTQGRVARFLDLPKPEEHRERGLKHRERGWSTSFRWIPGTTPRSRSGMPAAATSRNARITKRLSRSVVMPSASTTFRSAPGPGRPWPPSPSDLRERRVGTARTAGRLPLPVPWSCTPWQNEELR